MKSLNSKLKISLFFALCLALILSMSAFLTVNFAFADRAVTIDGEHNTNVLNKTDGANIWAHKDGSEYYLMAVLSSDDDAVNYRKNLAYEWYYNEEAEVNSSAPSSLKKALGLFEMEIGFENADFEYFVLTFESQQFTQTEDGKTTNYLFFVPAENGKLEVKHTVKEADDEDADEAYKHSERVGDISPDHIKIAFEKDDKTAQGTYGVKITSGSDTLNCTFSNIGTTYSKYVSSSVMPLSFKAKFPENNTKNARMALYSINKQLFRLGTFARATISEEEQANLTKYYTKGDYRYVKVAEGDAYDSSKTYYSYNPDVNTVGEGENLHYTLGDNSTVNDDTPPVICLDKGITHVNEGEEISFNYAVIDVLQSPTVTSNYFMLTNDQSKDSSLNAEDLSKSGLFREVKDSDNQYMIIHAYHYIPTESDYGADTVFGDDFTAKAAIKVYLKITDSYSGSSYVLLDWYVEDKYLLEIGGNKYIAVAKDETGATFAYTDNQKKESNPDSDSWNKITEDYQTEVDAAAEAQNLKAGTKNYFYLPSVEKLLSDGVSNYRDLTYSLYYKTDSDSGTTGQQVTSKNYSQLSINIAKTGKYIFTVYATDASGNEMYYYDKDSGELKTFAASEIWNMRAAAEGTDYEGLSHYIPWFEFEVGAAELKIEDPGEQSTAYVGTEYKISSFDINGVAYNSTYTLYRFNSERYYNDMKEAITYEKFMEEKETLFKEHRDDWFVKIYDINDMRETDKEYEIYGDYKWSAGSLSFVPQDDNAFYLVKCESTSTENQQKSAVAYMGISASVKVEALKGEDTWLQDNMTSIILLCIAGASLIGIVLLLVIKPKEKGDIDEVLANNAPKNKKSK